MRKMLLIGAGGHARSVVDSVERMGIFEIAGFVGSEDCFYRHYRTIGSDDDLERLHWTGIDCAFVALGYLGVGARRQELCTVLRDIGYELPSIVDPTAILAFDAMVGSGTYVGKGAVINAGATVGDMAIINTGAIVEHDCRVGDFSHVAVNATLCGAVSVGHASFVGAGATVCQGLSIGDNVVVGANATVLRSVDDGMKVVGVYHG